MYDYKITNKLKYKLLHDLALATRKNYASESLSQGITLDILHAKNTIRLVEETFDQPAHITPPMPPKLAALALTNPSLAKRVFEIT